MSEANQLTAEEHKWVTDLSKACAKAGLEVENRFMMAAFAIVAKGDMKKAITRIQNWTSVERQHRLSEISEEEVTVWMQKKCHNIYRGIGPNKQNLSGISFDRGEFNPYDLKTEEDDRMHAKAMITAIQSANCTIAEVRRGMALMCPLKGITLAKMNPSVTKKTNALTQQAYPVKAKVIYLVDAPMIVPASFHVLRLFMKKKIMDRFVLVSSDKLDQHYDASALPPELGGTLSEDWPTIRARGLARYRQSVLELEAAEPPTLGV